MDLLSNILQHKPREWDLQSYANKRYVRISLNRHSAEYQQISTEFTSKFGSSKRIIGIERVQHPFAFGRYQIRKEHLTKNRAEPAETRRMFPIIHKSYIDIILEYNCDKRRGGCYYSSSYLPLGASGYVLVVKVLEHNLDERDTDRYPEYVIQYGAECGSDSADEIGDAIFRLRLN